MMKRIISTLVIFSLVTYNSAIDVEQGLEGSISEEFSNGEELSARACRGEETINNLVEKLRKFLLEFPLDPYVIDNRQFTLTSTIIRGDLTVTNLILQGLAKFVKTDGCFDVGIISDSTLTLGLKLDEIKLTTKYTGVVDLFEMINIYGTGNASIALTGCSIKVTLYTKLKKIKKIEGVLVLPATDAKITGLQDNEYMSDIISRQLSDTLTTLAKEEEARINKILNAILEKVTEKLNEIIGGIGGENEITFTDEESNNILAAIMQILVEQDFIMDWTKNYFN